MDNYGLNMVVRNLKSSKVLIDSSKNSSDMLCDAAYFIQQVCEKMIKMQIYRLQGFNKIIDGHNICNLIARFKNLKGMYIPEDVIAHCRLLTNWEVKTRYDYDYTVDGSMVKYMYSIAKNWCEELYKLGYR